MNKKVTSRIKNLVWLLVLVAALCVVAGGCGGSSHSGSSGNSVVEALNNKTFESSSGTTGTGTATYSGGAVSVDISNVSVSFSNVTTAALASVQTAATTGNVTVSYRLTIGADSKDYSYSKSNVEISETSSGVYAFSFEDLSFTVDPTSKKVTFAGKFTLGSTEYTVSAPIAIGVNETVNVNSIWNGGWIYQSGSVSSDINGTKVDFAVQQLAIYFESSDVSKDEGSGNFSAVFCVSADVNLLGNAASFRLPLLFDKEAVKTKRTDEYTWTASTDHGVFSIDINPDTLVANFTGYTTGTSNDISLDLVIKKVSTGTAVDVDSTLKGTWLVISPDTSGGFLFTSKLKGMANMNNGYINSVFDNVDISKGSAHLMAAAVMPSTVVIPDSAGNVSASKMTLPLILSADMKLERIFGSIYRFEIPNDYQPTKGVIIFETTNTNKATIIMNSVTTNESVVMSVMFHIEKQPDDDTEFIQGLAASSTVWAADDAFADLAGGLVYSADIAQLTGAPFAPLAMSADAPFTVSLDVKLPSTITISADGDFVVGNNALTVNVKSLLSRLAQSETLELSVLHPGYRTLYAETEKSKFAVVFVNDNSAAIFAEIAPTGKKTEEVCSLAGLMKKQK